MMTGGKGREIMMEGGRKDDDGREMMMGGRGKEMMMRGRGGGRLIGGKGGGGRMMGGRGGREDDGREGWEGG